MKEEFVPKWIAWEVTQKCNLKCVHCRCSSDEGSSEGDFTTEEGKKLLTEIARFSKPVVVLSGGEPLLRKDIFELAEFGSSLGLRMCMATNGALVDDEMCRKMRQVDIKMVSLSLDGSSAAIHDDFRQCKGAFDGVIRAAEAFRRNGQKFLINSSFTKRNQADIPEVFRLAKSLGATAWYMFMIVPTGRGEEIMSELISKEDYEEILEWHYQQEKNEDAILMRPTCAPHYYRVAVRGCDYAFVASRILFQTVAGCHLPRPPDNITEQLPGSRRSRDAGLASLKKFFCQSIQELPSFQRHNRHAVHQITSQPLGNPAQKLLGRLPATRCLDTQKPLPPVSNIVCQHTKHLVPRSLVTHHAG